MSRPTPSSTADAHEPSADASPEASPHRLEEAELEALRRRDPRAVREHIYGNKDYLRSVLRRYTKNDETARDLLQETFFQALRSLPNFRGEAKLTTWLYSIAKNVALARYRDDKRRSPLDEETLTHVLARTGERPGGGTYASWDPVEETSRNDDVARLREALDELSENYREIIELRDLKEFSTEEVADQLGLTRVNVRVRLHRARQKLEDILTNRFEDEVSGPAVRE